MVRESEVRILEPSAVLLEEQPIPQLASPDVRDLLRWPLECTAALAEANADKRAIAAQLDGMKQAESALKKPETEPKKSWWKFWK